jgi:hypothetical protein
VILVSFVVVVPALNPDSAVPADAMSEEQTFRSKSQWVSPEPAFKVQGSMFKVQRWHQSYDFEPGTLNLER